MRTLPRHSTGNFQSDRKLNHLHKLWLLKLMRAGISLSFFTMADFNLIPMRSSLMDFLEFKGACSGFTTERYPLKSWFTGMSRPCCLGHSYSRVVL